MILFKSLPLTLIIAEDAEKIILKRKKKKTGEDVIYVVIGPMKIAQRMIICVKICGLEDSQQKPK